ncbi:hypothetical protein J2X01_002884 [Arthrobacter ginsengisoli]|uniref:Uncharacterized protein n=1 Tax=Arthrobacter ginsengisoli TaxID=1356565 RepID=A0ABU1UEH2_9MICC|nr:hypothetical protein [Arthrobacter ginsengisoli]MDR7083589.1 hypothetical protein [Arthrobacter ginsengisoli]
MQLEIDVNAAGLLAQVIPVLLIFVALEDRLNPAKIQSTTWRHRLKQATELSVGAGIVSLLLCLWVVIAKAPNFFTTIFVGISMFFLLANLFLLFAGMFGREDMESGTVVAKTVKIPHE